MIVLLLYIPDQLPQRINIALLIQCVKSDYFMLHFVTNGGAVGHFAFHRTIAVHNQFVAQTERFAFHLLCNNRTHYGIGGNNGAHRNHPNGDPIQKPRIIRKLRNIRN